MIEIIKKLCFERGTNVTNLCKEITGSTGNLATWNKGNIRNDYLLKIADYFNVSTDYLLGKTNDPSPPGSIQDDTDALLERLKGYSAAFYGGAEDGLTKGKRAILEAAIQIIEEDEEEKNKPHIETIRAAARGGEGIEEITDPDTIEAIRKIEKEAGTEIDY